MQKMLLWRLVVIGWANSRNGGGWSVERQHGALNSGHSLLKLPPLYHWSHLKTAGPPIMHALTQQRILLPCLLRSNIACPNVSGDASAVGWGAVGVLPVLVFISSLSFVHISFPITKSHLYQGEKPMSWVIYDFYSFTLLTGLGDNP